MNQTNKLPFTRNDDLGGKVYYDVGAKKEDFAGIWYNTNKSTDQVVRIEIANRENTFFFHAFGACSPEDCDWGEIKCDVFSSRVDSPIIEGLTALYDFEFMETQVAANLKYGILVIQTYNLFKDDSNRNNYFTREFFHKKKPLK